MAALNQATGANVAQQGALMAGQRGSAQNAGLMARQIGQQGAATQQQAVGQGATMQAQQSLGAMQQLGSQQQAMQSVAGQQVGQQQTGLQNLNQANLQNQSNQMGLQSSANSANAGIAGANAQAQGNILGGLAGGAGAALMLMADGGEATANGQPPMQPTMPMTSPNVPQQPQQSGPRSAIGQMFQNSSTKNTLGTGSSALGSAIGQGIKSLFSSNQDTPGADKAFAAFNAAPEDPIANTGSGNMYGVQNANPAALEAANSNYGFAKGGKVPALVSPGEIRIPAKDVKSVASGKKSPLAGEKIPGKPKIAGARNSYANDTVKKTLNEGDIILPRSVTQSKNPHWAAHKFISDIMAGKHKGKK